MSAAAVCASCGNPRDHHPYRHPFVAKVRERRVLVVQQVLHRNGDGQLVPKHDLSPAAEFGELVPLLGQSAAPWGVSVAQELHAKLRDLDPEQDTLLLIGNPALIGMVVAIAAEYTDGVLSVLQWSGREQRYTRIKLDLRYDLLPED